MAKQNGIYGVYFIKGAFFLQLKEVDGNLGVYPIVSKNYKQLKQVIGGTFKDMDELMSSDKSEIAKEYFNTLEFDYMVMGHGDTVSYYLNTKDGIVKCDLAYLGC